MPRFAATPQTPRPPQLPKYVLILSAANTLPLGKHVYTISPGDRVVFHVSNFGAQNVFTIASVYSPEVLRAVLKKWISHTLPGCGMYSLQRVLDYGTVGCAK